MANLTSQHEDMLYDNSLNRSPSNATARGYNPIGLNRQPSRNFEQPYLPQHQQAGLYASDLHQFEHRTQRLPPPQQLYNNNSYNHIPYQDWNAYAPGSNAATMGASSRMRPSNRRAPLPSVSFVNSSLMCQLTFGRTGPTTARLRSPLMLHQISMLKCLPNICHHIRTITMMDRRVMLSAKVEAVPIWALPRIQMSSF